MTHNIKEKTIETDNFYKRLLIVALPIALQNTISASLNLVDNLMVGRLGEAELTAVGLSAQIFFVQYMVQYGFLGGSATFLSQFWGIKEIKSVKKVIGIDVIAGLMLTTFIFFLPALICPHLVLQLFTDDPYVIELGSQYMRICSFSIVMLCFSFPLATALRVTEQTKTPMMISFCTCIINIVINYILIFGKLGMPELGVKGAAIGTLIARTCEFLMYLFVVFVRKNIISGHIKEYFSFDRTLVKHVTKNSIPTMINETMWGAGMATYNAAYGHMGTSAFAAVQAGITINDLFTMAIFSMGDAALILVGQELGRKNMDYAYSTAKRILKIGGIVGIISGATLILTSKIMIGFFNFTDQTASYGEKILMVYGAFMVIKVMNGIHITGTLRSGGDTKFAMITEVCLVWGVGVPIVFIGAMYFKLPVYIVVLLAQSEEVIKFIVTNIRFFSKKWLNNMIDYDR